MKKIIITLILCLASLTPTQAGKVNLDVTLATTTQYPNCRGYLDDIFQYWNLLASKEAFFAKNPGFVDQILDEIKTLKKAFKKCEKSKGKKAYDPTIKIGGGFDFDIDK